MEEEINMGLFSGTKGGMPEISTYIYSPVEMPEDNSLGILATMLYNSGKEEAKTKSKSSKDDDGIKKIPALQASGDRFVAERNALQQEKNALISKTKAIFEKYGSNPKAFLNSKEGIEFQRQATYLTLKERAYDNNVPRLTQELQQWKATEKKMEDSDEGDRVALDNKFNPMGTKYNKGEAQIGIDGYIPTNKEYLSYLDTRPGNYNEDGYVVRAMPTITKDDGEWEKFLSEQGKIAQNSMNEGAGRNVSMNGTGAGVLLDDKGNPTDDYKSASIGSTYNYLRTSKVGGNNQAVNTILKEYQDKMPDKARRDLMKQFWGDVKSGRLNEDLMMDKSGRVVDRGGDYVYTEDERQALKDMRAGSPYVDMGVIEGIKNRYTHLRVFKDLDLYRKSTYDPYFLNAGSPGDYKEKYPEQSWQETAADPAFIQTAGQKIEKAMVIQKSGKYVTQPTDVWLNYIPLLLQEGFKNKYFRDNKGVATVDLMNYITHGSLIGGEQIINGNEISELNADSDLKSLPVLDFLGFAAAPVVKRDQKTGDFTRQIIPWTTKNGQTVANTDSYMMFNVFVKDLDEIPAIIAKNENSIKGNMAWRGDDQNNEEYWKGKSKTVKPYTYTYETAKGKIETVKGWSVEWWIPTPSSQALNGTSESTFNVAKGNMDDLNMLMNNLIKESESYNNAQAAFSNPKNKL